MSSYDLVDLYFEMGEKLPGELACLVFEMLREDPSRLDGRCEELVLRIVESWKVRFPIDGEVEEAVALLKPRTTIPEKIPEGYPTEKMPLLSLVTKFVKGTRPMPDFAAKFRLVNMRLMPHVVNLFPTQTKP